MIIPGYSHSIGNRIFRIYASGRSTSIPGTENHITSNRSPRSIRKSRGYTLANNLTFHVSSRGFLVEQQQRVCPNVGVVYSCRQLGPVNKTKRQDLQNGTTQPRWLHRRGRSVRVILERRGETNDENDSVPCLIRHWLQYRRHWPRVHLLLSRVNTGWLQILSLSLSLSPLSLSFVVVPIVPAVQLNAQCTHGGAICLVPTEGILLARWPTDFPGDIECPNDD